MIPVLEWFASCQIITKNSVADAYGLEAEQLKDDDYRHVIASMLRVADFGIQSLQMRDAEPAPSQRNDIFTNIEAIHTVQDTEGNTSSYALNMAEESDGTNSYFKLIGVVKKVLDEGTLLVADEMDAHLHPLLTKHLVSLFNSVEFNPNGAQLIFTSHNTNLLDLDVLRRDQIWFTEKTSKQRLPICSPFTIFHPQGCQGREGLSDWPLWCDPLYQGRAVKWHVEKLKSVDSDAEK